jgi:hypothetical protein
MLERVIKTVQAECLAASRVGTVQEWTMFSIIDHRVLRRDLLHKVLSEISMRNREETPSTLKRGRPMDKKGSPPGEDGVPPASFPLAPFGPKIRSDMGATAD